MTPLMTLGGKRGRDTVDVRGDWGLVAGEIRHDSCHMSHDDTGPCRRFRYSEKAQVLQRVMLGPPSKSGASYGIGYNGNTLGFQTSRLHPWDENLEGGKLKY